MNRTWRIKLRVIGLAILSVLILGELFQSKKGEQEKLYIGSPQDLLRFSESVNQGNTYQGFQIIVTRDIDMEGIKSFIPIGMWERDCYFKGIFDGNGHTIRNLTILPYDEYGNVGLFGALDGIVCNLVLENCYIQGNIGGAVCGVAAENDIARIYNCEVRNSVIDAKYTDIFGGQYFGRKENCVIDGEGDVSQLNENLAAMNRDAAMTKDGIGDVAFNLWRSEDGKAVLTSEKANCVTGIELRLDVNYPAALQPVYQQKEDIYWFVLPGGTSLKNARLVMKFLDGEEWNHTLTEQEEKLDVDALGYTWHFQFSANGELPSIHVDTERRDAVAYLGEDKENKLPGLVTILDKKGALCYSGKLKHVKGRGNNSFLEPKKGFNLKLEDKADLLGLGKAKNFALIPGYRDTSLITYRIVQDLCQKLNFDYALESQLVDLYFQGEYQGVYLLTEKIEIGNNRIEISESSEVEKSGYLFEFNKRDTLTVPIVSTQRGNIYGIRGPSSVSGDQLAFCSQIWEAFEEALFSSDGYNSNGDYYADLMDLESLAKQWLVYEACGEYSIFSSIFYYLKPPESGDGKLHALQPWDVEHSFTPAMDSAVNNIIVGGEASGSANGRWAAMLQHNDFQKEAARIWMEELRPLFLELLEESENLENGMDSLTDYANIYRNAMARNELCWGEEQNLDVKINYMRSWIERRTIYLDKIMEQRAA